MPQHFVDWRCSSMYALFDRQRSSLPLVITHVATNLEILGHAEAEHDVRRGWWGGCRGTARAGARANDQLRHLAVSSSWVECTLTFGMRRAARCCPSICPYHTRSVPSAVFSRAC